MPLKLKITSSLDKDGNLDYKKGKLRKFYSKLKPAHGNTNSKAVLDLYLVHRIKEKSKNNIPGDGIFAGKIMTAVAGEKDKAGLLLSSRGSIRSKKFFETVCEVFKSNE